MASEKDPQDKDSIKSGGDSTSTGIIAATRSNDPKSGEALAESLEAKSKANQLGNSNNLEGVEKHGNYQKIRY